MIFLMVLALLASVHADPILRFKPNNLNQITCPDQSVCDDDNTCCLLESGEYGCCPYVKATCCSDKAHCCPQGTKCDMAESKCLKGDISFPWMEKTKASPPGTIMCPDRQSYCPTSQYTCCKSSIGEYECCPQPKATCCSDGQHCCPTGYTCDEATSMCKRGNTEMFWYEKLPAQKLPSLFEVQDVNCPDGKSTCPSGSSCCALKDGYYGCCPFDGAVCCDDKKHCCPSGYTCNSSSCVKGIVTLSFTEVITKKTGNVKCQDGQSYCPPMSTCCKQDNGYGCCPLENAECCSDGLHCCPEGYKCDIAGGTCENYSSTVELIKHSPAKLTSEANPVTLEAVVCPDGQSQCPDSNTCCKLSSGQYGCCPLPSAVCCSDGLHCCPSGYTCDVSGGTCTKGALTVPWTIKTEAKQVVTTKNPVCPDGHSQCPDSYTCCKMSTGQWGCCPLPNAVCCEDGIHCCPKDNICDDATPGCIHGDVHTPWYEKVPALSVESVVCPDGQSQCPDGNTCCKLSSGQYGCCPLPKAVCCSDGLHCCPSGYTCDVSAGTCTKGALTVPWLEKTEAKSIKLEAVMCPDGQSQCPDGNTCCKLSSGQYGCCPLQSAVCCSDGLHCCPSGYTCDVSAGTCTKGALTVPWLEKTEAKSVMLENVQCDSTYYCPDGSTCCKLSSGQYGCCPIPNAVCCSDGQHCCPSGYTCDVSGGTCTKGALTVPWLEKTEARSITLESVVCPDGQSQCPDGNTCCKLSSGQYGCCPLQSAVCCSDGLHCCPSGYKCDVSGGTCTKGALTVPWLEKTEAKSIKLEAVMCPDGQSQCPDGNTCCKLSSGQYGCCPLPKAVCCSDGLHCCPSGYTCDVSAGTCTKGSLTVPWLEKTEAKSVMLENVQCDSTYYCPDGSTCCKLSSGQYGCCPIPNAVCCSDGQHCCPSGYTCDVSGGTCTKGALTVPWLEKTEARSITLESVVCPDGQSQCPDGNTCCKLSSGQYGCCPLQSAVCCSDGLHCCPSGYKCDVSGGTCTKGALTVPWLEKTEAKSIKLEAVMCPDGQSQCPDGNTCCKLSSGQYGCCPLPKAVCCSDGLHCCPSGYTCDVSAGTCTKGSLTVPWLEKTEAKSVMLENVQCDSTYYCPDGSTCCKLSSGQYGCCPIPNAVCCSDGQHCCPSGYTCDISGGTCTKGALTVPWLEKTEARSITLESVVCPDGQSQCPDGNTCCKLSSGQYGCCPLQSAVCCSDGLHCCPSGYTCDVSGGTCTKGALTVPWLEKTEAKSIKLEAVMCPDGQSQCPDGNTCCKLSSGQYGCCPLQSAVCCSDGLHCCPSGYTCDVSAGTCTKGALTVPWLEKTEAKSVMLENVQCDSTYYCPDGSTCCKLSSGQYGCCPIPNAVCCSDGQHCCPSGYKCDTSGGTCTKGALTVPWLEKTEARSITLESVVCPDGQSQCPDGNTCCKLSSGQYGCCPLQSAVCCSDGLHCCPSGYTCDVSGGTCTKGALTVPWLEKTEAKSIHLEDVVCPDGQSQCPDGNTCCKLSSGQYGCCPLQSAVCCSDGVHCCPSGYTCDVSGGTCTKGAHTVPWLEKTEAKSIHLEDVVCPDGQSQCPDGNTCCKLSSGQYGCCPLQSAVCCSDGLHCCPSGYTCDVSAGTCTKGALTQPWVEKTEARSITLESVVCPDGQSQCPDGNTCCKLSSGQYGCCPLQSAVCCSDGLHCCPSGYTCDVSGGTCTKGALTVPWLEKTEAKSLNLKSVTCPDGQSQCPDNHTCCELTTGQYGCCPLPNAQCCSDGQHCCPKGYSCDSITATCFKGLHTVPWVEKTEALSVMLENVQCDSTHYCPDGSTCCKLSSGQYGCCPIPNAVCCSDGQHCCPSGYTCDVSGGTCTKGALTVPWLEKTEAISIKLEAVICPDGQSQCPDGNTCCKLSSGQYGCCPLQSAVCCSDGLHCCPSGYTCDVSAGTCTKGALTQPWVEKTEARSITLESVVCPDGQSQCPDGNTCCKLSSGQYGCCPLQSAVCCSDGVHCCPSGYTCDVSGGTCTKGALTVPWLEKTEAKSLNLKSVTCPDGQSQCPDNHTCCELTTGQYGCCPLPNAQCCSDGQHCCPKGYSCDSITATCFKGAHTVPWVTKQPASLRNVICPGGRAECDSGNTCCKLSSGEYGCCPLPKAVCCSDKLHCCPEGQTCDTSEGKCLSGDQSTPWLTKTAARPVTNIQAIVCPDGRSQCPNGNTCCESRIGTWLCCPLRNAVCCSDGVNCCPSGYTCNVVQGTCVRQSDIAELISLISN